MRFGDLAIGQAFDYQDAAWIKTGPNLARRAAGGEQKFLPRSTVVRVEAPATPPVPPPPAGKVERARLLAALAVFEQEIAALLPAAERDRLAQAKARLLAALEGD